MQIYCQFPSPIPILTHDPISPKGTEHDTPTNRITCSLSLRRKDPYSLKNSQSAPEGGRPADTHTQSMRGMRGDGYNNTILSHKK